MLLDVVDPVAALGAGVPPQPVHRLDGVPGRAERAAPRPGQPDVASVAAVDEFLAEGLLQALDPPGERLLGDPEPACGPPIGEPGWPGPGTMAPWIDTTPIAGFFLLNRDSKRKIQSSVGWKKEDRLFASDAFNIVSTIVAPQWLYC